MSHGKPLFWMHGDVKSPPFSKNARLETGILLRRLQLGENLYMPHSRPMPSVEKKCHQLRINDKDKTWRILYAVESDAIVILEVFQKKTDSTPDSVMTVSRKRIRMYRSF